MGTARRRGLGAFLTAAVFLFAVAGGHGAAVYCLHADGSAALETGADRCCRAAPGAPGPARAGSKLRAPEGACPGCQDLPLDWSRQLRPRAHPLVHGWVLSPGAAASSAVAAPASIRVAHRRGSAQGPGPPIAVAPLRI